MNDDQALAEAKAVLHRDGRPLNGGIHLSAEVHCAICERAFLGLAYPLSEAERELRGCGWSTRSGLWVCPDHSASRKETQGTRTR